MTLIALVGFLAGIFLNILGPGGGVVATPLLYYWLKMSFLEANFIASLFVLLICLYYSIKNFKNISWYNTSIIGISGILFTPVGVAVAHFFSTSHIKLFFSIVTFLITVITIATKLFEHNSKKEVSSTIYSHNKFLFHILLLILGILSGLLSGLLGIGGGFFIIPILTILLIPKDIAQQIAFTSVAMILFSSLSYKLFYHALHDELEILQILSFILCGFLSFSLIQYIKKIHIYSVLLINICCLILIIMSYFEFIQYIYH
jgi:uncharacterized membrane protein YfcA